MQPPQEPLDDLASNARQEILRLFDAGLLDQDEATLALLAIWLGVRQMQTRALKRATLRFVSASQNITHRKETRLWRNQQDEMSQLQLCVRDIRLQH